MIKPLLFLSFLPAAVPASAATLVGFHTFTNDQPTAEVPDEGLGFFSSSNLVKGTNSLNSGGSNDATYGAALAVATGSSSNGLMRITNSSTLTLNYVGGASPIQLGFLYFDAIRATTNTTGLNITYTFNGNPSTPFQAFPAGAGTNQTTAGVTYDYDDYSLDLSSVVMNPGQSLTVTFAADSARLDNIAITGEFVPEPSAAVLAALGIMPFFLRRR